MSEPDPTSMLRVMRGLLRPLVRILISRGVTAPAFYRLLKSVYVEVANDDFRIGEKPPTDSRITLLTGVHRRDVRAILSDPDNSWDTQRAKTAMLATIIGQWLARPEFTDEDGRPRALPRSGADGADFDGLIAGISRDIRPRTILDELVQRGLVTETEEGFLQLNDEAFAGPSSEDDQIVFFAANTGDHLAAATENLMADQPRFLERAVFYNRLTPESVDKVEEKARRLAQSVLEDLNMVSSNLQKSDRNETDRLERYRFGVYFYREPADVGTNKASGDDESDQS